MGINTHRNFSALNAEMTSREGEKCREGKFARAHTERGGSSATRLLHDVLTLGIQCRSRLVQQEDPRLQRQRTSDGNALLLTARELDPSLPHEGVVAAPGRDVSVSYG